MTQFFIQFAIKISISAVIFDRMKDGGILSMSILLLCLLTILFLLARGIYYFKKNNPMLGKMITLTNSIGLFALVLGIFGPLLQLIEILDSMEAVGGIEAHQMAGGLKQTILPTLFGSFIFLVSRVFTITLNWLKPHFETN